MSNKDERKLNMLFWRVMRSCAERLSHCEVDDEAKEVINDMNGMIAKQGEILLLYTIRDNLSELMNEEAEA